MAPTRWAIARIIKVHLGQDGRVHTVTVRTSEAVYNQSVAKAGTLGTRTKLENHVVLAGGMSVPGYMVLNRASIFCYFLGYSFSFN